FRLQVCLLYHGLLVQKVISSSPEGCFILQGSAPVGSERIYGPCAAHKLFFPRVDVTPLPLGIGQAMSCLLPHLEKGVLVWVAPDGVFIKRFCQGRVYWYGPLAQYSNKPNKLERERTCKLLDIHIFLQELHRYLQGGGPRPRYEIDLCFGEEFPDATQPKSKKLITAQVVPLFAHELLVQLKLVKGQGRTSVSCGGAAAPELRSADHGAGAEPAEEAGAGQGAEASSAICSCQAPPLRRSGCRDEPASRSARGRR
ncbi:hypothetical protein P4O66_022188, partial [Electrophorus voltai]